MVNENASLVKYEPPKCDECGRKIVVLSDLCAKCADGIELNGKKQANRPGTNPLPTWPKPPAPPNPPPAPAVEAAEPRFPFAGFDPNFCPSSNPENPQEDQGVAVNQQLFSALQLFIDTVEEPPEANCSCHIAPPCGDCVNYSQLREAFEEGRAAIAAAEAAKGGSHVPD